MESLNARQARFAVGQIVQHQLFDYRGVIYDVDPVFLGTEEWYERVAQSRPPKDEAWYRVLPHGEEHTTYVAEQNLAESSDEDPVEHPLIGLLFDDHEDGTYTSKALTH